jgi:hypothetical protein
MKKTPAWRRYLTFWRNDIVHDVDDELQFLVEMRVAEYMGSGLTKDEALRAVAERLGDVDAAKAECVEQSVIRERHTRNADFVDGLRVDLYYGARAGSNARAPGTRLVQGLLYGVPCLDPFAFGVGALLLLLVAIVACVVPMWRATGVDPVVAVRAD